MSIMATLLRVFSRQGRHLRAISRLKQYEALTAPLITQRALISTSDKKKDVTGTIEPMKKSSELKQLTEHFGNIDKDKEENYTSYGIAPGDRDTDWFSHHFLMFITFSCLICWGGFIVAYMPDQKFNDWCNREAFLELERRERKGLPLVDRNYVDSATIELPSDEEIGDQEIII